MFCLKNVPAFSRGSEALARPMATTTTAHKAIRITMSIVCNQHRTTDRSISQTGALSAMLDALYSPALLHFFFFFSAVTSPVTPGGQRQIFAFFERPHPVSSLTHLPTTPEAPLADPERTHGGDLRRLSRTHEEDSAAKVRVGERAFRSRILPQTVNLVLLAKKRLYEIEIDS